MHVIENCGKFHSIAYPGAQSLCLLHSDTWRPVATGCRVLRVPVSHVYGAHPRLRTPETVALQWAVLTPMRPHNSTVAMPVDVPFSLGRGTLIGCPCTRPHAGFNTVCCLLGQRSAGKVSLRVQQLDVACETKSRDNVFVQIVVSVQYQVRASPVKMTLAGSGVDQRWCSKAVLR